MTKNKNVNKYNTLVRAVRAGNIELTKAVVSSGVYPDQRIFGIVVEYGNLDIIKYLISTGIDYSDNYDFAMILSASRGYFEVLKYLISIGADPTCENDILVHATITSGQLEIVKYLVDVGAHINTKRTSIMFDVTVRGHLEMVKYLVSIGMCYGNNLIIASIYGHLDIVKYFVSIGADIGIDNHYAIKCTNYHEHPEIIEYLVSIGEFDERLDPYLYIKFLDHRHLQFITDSRIRKMIVERENRRMITLQCTNYYDVLIKTIN